MSTLKAEILSVLAGRPGQYFSGGALADQFNVSRNAVWKAIRQLQTEGYAIDGITNKGYALTSDGNIISEACIRHDLTARIFGRKIRIYPELDSTNSAAKALADQEDAHGTVIIADSQSGGRGRYGRPFFSPKKSGIYMSLFLRPSLKAEQALMITSCAAVAVAEAIEKLYPVNVQIKWVNDLYVNQRKVCGILTEAGIGFENGQLDYVVIGIGVNTGAVTFPKDLAPIATSLENETGIAVSRNRLIAEILNSLESRFETMTDGSFLQESRRRSILLGREILVISANETYPAKAIDIDSHGFLIAETANGRVSLNSGEVSIRLSPSK